MIPTHNKILLSQAYILQGWRGINAVRRILELAGEILGSRGGLECYVHLSVMVTRCLAADLQFLQLCPFSVMNPNSWARTECFTYTTKLKEIRICHCKILGLKIILS